MVVKTSGRVLLFGTFDPLHDGHRDLFRQAHQLGRELLVIVARDSSIRATKQRAPVQSEVERVAAVAGDPHVHEVRLGDADPTSYTLLRTLSFDVLALGYDQTPSDDEVQSLLKQVGRPEVRVVRLQPYEPERFKSSHFRHG